jgi:hypothetical protein
MSLTHDTLRSAIAEAERFLIRARALADKTEGEPHVYGGPEAAAMKRASMDLTRSLAEMRSR